MKTIGVIGGMSWESTELYYRLINQSIKKSLGGHHSAKIVMASVDFQELVDALQVKDWAHIARVLINTAQRLETAGADFLLIATNTMHRVAPEIEASVSIPLLHIIDATAQTCHSKKCETVGLLGTRFTMEESFYKERLEAKGLNVLLPASKDFALINKIIFDELVMGLIEEKSRAEYLRIIKDLQDRGAQGIIEGCTEIGLLITPDHTHLPLFDTARIHAQAAARLALSD